MTQNRREFLSVGGMALLASSLSPSLFAQQLASKQTVGPRRVVFFLQNQGFHANTVLPKGIERQTCSLAGRELPEPVKALQPYVDRMNIINGAHGLHTSPSHSAYFGALGGYHGSVGFAPRGITIDARLSQLLPPAILPMLCLGMDSLPNMMGRSSVSTLSAWGPNRGVYMNSNPKLLYQTLFGAIADAKLQAQFEGELKINQELEKLSKLRGKSLPEAEYRRYQTMEKGISDLNALSQKIIGFSDNLRPFLPKYDARYELPTVETDWHDVLLDIGIASLQSGLTNVLNISSGRGGIDGSWNGLGIKEAGHNLGHVDQSNPVWTMIRQYNCKMLVKIIKALESVPEGDGTMMDNTLIVYTSNNADHQHTDGANWPFLTLGNWGGAIKTGQHIQVEKNRPINAIYTGLLHAVGENIDRFNMDPGEGRKHDSGIGPVESLLA